jgi:transcriptional regulator with XRE-family HTH domain
MPPNNIKKIRTAQGLSQRTLAKLAKTSQQQIQRIEAGKQTARLEVVVSICHALGETIDKVFPGTKKLLKKVNALPGAEDAWVALTDPAHEDEFEKAGIDSDPAIWTLKLLMTGGIEHCIQIPAPEKKRLFQVLQSETDDFVLFSSLTSQVALNTRHLLFWHFLFDAPILVAKEEEESNAVSVWFAGVHDPVTLGMEPDTAEMDEGEDRADQLQSALSFLEIDGNSEDMRISLVDEDGEEAFFRAPKISLFEVPLSLVDLIEDEDEEETQEAPSQPPVTVQ